jgi:hypothetical protein
MSHTFVTVATFTNPIEAQLAAGRLEDEDIEVFLSGDLTASMLSGFGSFSRVELRVPEEEAERAAALLATPAIEEEPDPNWPRPGEEEDLWLCTLCGDAVALDLDVCPACQTPREAIRDEPATRSTRLPPSPLQPPEGIQKTGDVTTGPPAIPEHELAEDDLELPPLDTVLGDDLVNRAFRAALFGCFFPPLTVYSLWLLLRLALFRGDLSPAGMRKLYGTLLLDGGVCLLWAAGVFLFGFRNPW